MYERGNRMGRGVLSPVWINSCMWRISWSAGIFPGDKSSGNDRLRLQSKFHLHPLHLPAVLSTVYRTSSSICVCTALLPSSSTVLAVLLLLSSRASYLRGKQTGALKTPNPSSPPPVEHRGLDESMKNSCTCLSCFTLSSSWPSGKIGSWKCRKTALSKVCVPLHILVECLTAAVH